MAQNEMRAKAALPERVRSMEGLGVGWVGAPLSLPDWRQERAQAETEGCVFITLNSARQVCGAVARAACIYSCQPLQVVSSPPAKRDGRPAQSGAGEQHFETSNWYLKRVRETEWCLCTGSAVGQQSKPSPLPKRTDRRVWVLLSDWHVQFDSESATPNV